MGQPVLVAMSVRLDSIVATAKELNHRSIHIFVLPLFLLWNRGIRNCCLLNFSFKKVLSG